MIVKAEQERIADRLVELVTGLNTAIERLEGAVHLVESTAHQIAGPPSMEDGCSEDWQEPDVYGESYYGQLSRQIAQISDLTDRIELALKTL